MNKKFRKAVAGSVAGVLTALSNVGSASAVFDVSKSEASANSYMTVGELLDHVKVPEGELIDRIRALSTRKGLEKGLFFRWNDKIGKFQLAYVCKSIVRAEKIASDLATVGNWMNKKTVPVFFEPVELSSLVGKGWMEADKVKIDGVVNAAGLIAFAKDVASELDNDDWADVQNSDSGDKGYWVEFFRALNHDYHDVFSALFGEYVPEKGAPVVISEENGQLKETAVPAVKPADNEKGEASDDKKTNKGVIYSAIALGGSGLLVGGKLFCGNLISGDNTALDVNAVPDDHLGYMDDSELDF